MGATTPTRVIIIGGGFGGLAAARGLKRLGSLAEVTLVDRQNHHVFQPLLYQVATAGLAGSDIAQPIRAILRSQRNARVIMGELSRIDLDARRVEIRRESPAAGLHAAPGGTHREPGIAVDYDFLVIAMGVETNWFGHEEWSRHALGLKTLSDAAAIRRRVLYAYEEAENEDDAARRRMLLTTVIVGGGATGIEVAGACAELSRHALKGEFRRIDPAEARVMVVEAGPTLLPGFPPDLCDAARRALTAMGVEVRTQTRVVEIGPDRVELDSGGVEARTIVWAAGVRAPSITRTLGVETDSAGRIVVGPDCAVKGRPDVFAIGDVMRFVDARGRAVPAVAQGAMQSGAHVARVIAAEIGRGAAKAERGTFRYRDKGMMATIGRSRAVAHVFGKRFTGLTAWLLWLTIHLLFLVSLRSKITVLVQWTWAYFRYRPGARVIYRPDGPGDGGRY